MFNLYNDLLLLETAGQPDLEMDGRFKKVSDHAQYNYAVSALVGAIDIYN